MKDNRVIVVFAVLIFFVIGCGRHNNRSVATPPPPQPEASQPSTDEVRRLQKKLGEIEAENARLRNQQAGQTVTQPATETAPVQQPGAKPERRPIVEPVLPPEPPALESRIVEQSPTPEPAGEETDPALATATVPRFDFKIVSPLETTYGIILRDQAEIERQLKQLAANNPKDDAARLLRMPWEDVTKWRLDPVTVKGGSIAKMPPTPVQEQELFDAIDRVLQIPASAKSEFKRRIHAGDCKEGYLPSRFLEKMVNGVKATEKVRVSPDLVKRTKVCQFVLKGVNEPIDIIYDCGNFAFFFVRQVHVIKPSEPGVPVQPQKPPQAGCQLIVDGKPVNPDVPITLFPDQTVTFLGEVVGAADSLEPNTQWLWEGVPKLGNANRFMVNPVLFNYKPGTYAGSFDVTDQFGRKTSCPFKVRVNPVIPMSAPPTVTQTTKPPTPPHGMSGWKKLLIVAAIAGGAAAAGIILSRRGHEAYTPNKPGLGNVCVIIPGTTNSSPGCH